MSCSRAFEIDVEDLLAEPESLELGALESHSAGCPDCASELALQRGLMARLRGGDAADEARHPSDALLLGLRRDPDSLSDPDRAGLRAHLRDCPPCDDAFRAIGMLGTFR
jgi:anti-sigma factor RsiW